MFKSFAKLSVALLCLAAALHADIIETRNGARLIGTVTGVNNGVITLSTEYAGTLRIQQSEVVKFETDQPITVRLSGGTVMTGKITAAADGKIVVNGEDGLITTTVEKVAATWGPGQKDPAVAALLRHWKFEVSADMTGKTGNKEELGFGAGARATLAGPEDTLMFYTSFAYQQTDKRKSKDNFRLGMDYANYLGERTTWYARDEAGYDNVKNINFFNVAASGFGYDFIRRKDIQKLTARVGLAYRFEDYGGAFEDVRSAGLDLGLAHTYRFTSFLMSNSLTFVPAFDDFSNYRAVHDSHLQFPLTSHWNFRVGMNNDYTSTPSPGVKKLDTTYYGRFVLNWQ